MPPLKTIALVVALLIPGTASATTAIVAAENFYGDLAKQIGGDFVTVTSILSNPDEDPHLFETSPSTAKAIAGARILIYNGADYDPWMDKLLGAAGKTDRTKIVAAELVGRKSGDNPHVWYDPATLPAVAEALAADLAAIDTAHASTFRANLASFKSSFAKLISEVDAIKANHGGLAVTATEPVFGYMAGALGFKMLNYDFQIATMNNAEPSPSQVIAFEKSLTDRQAKILFYNSQVTDKTTERLLKIARDHKVMVIGVTETEPKGKTIQSWFGGQIDEIRAGLGAK